MRPIQTPPSVQLVCSKKRGLCWIIPTAASSKKAKRGYVSFAFNPWGILCELPTLLTPNEVRFCFLGPIRKASQINGFIQHLSRGQNRSGGSTSRRQSRRKERSE